MIVHFRSDGSLPPVSPIPLDRERQQLFVGLHKKVLSDSLQGGRWRIKQYEFPAIAPRSPNMEPFKESADGAAPRVGGCVSFVSSLNDIFRSLLHSPPFPLTSVAPCRTK